MTSVSGESTGMVNDVCVQGHLRAAHQDKGQRGDRPRPQKQDNCSDHVQTRPSQHPTI
jgi:hypothetical protein